MPLNWGSKFIEWLNSSQFYQSNDTEIGKFQWETLDTKILWAAYLILWQMTHIHTLLPNKALRGGWVDLTVDFFITLGFELASLFVWVCDVIPQIAVVLENNEGKRKLE